MGQDGPAVILRNTKMPHVRSGLRGKGLWVFIHKAALGRLYCGTDFVFYSRLKYLKLFNVMINYSH